MKLHSNVFLDQYNEGHVFRLKKQRVPFAFRTHAWKVSNGSK